MSCKVGNGISKVKKAIIIVLCFLSFLLLFLVSYQLYRRGNMKSIIKRDVVIEYGEIITIHDIIRENLEDKKITIEPKLETLHTVGRHKIFITIDSKKYSTYIEIKDTTAPTLEVRDLSIYTDEEVPKAQQFVVFLHDLSEVKLEDVKIEKTVGTHTVKIVAKDKYNNVVVKEAKLEIKEDKEPPIFSGLTDLSIFQGEKPDLKRSVEAVDKRLGNVLFTVDDTSVNYDKVGTYEVYYKAVDQAGNAATALRKVIVKPKDITYMIPNFPTYNQYPQYPNGCESIALYVLLKYYGVSVSPNEIVDKLKKGDGPHLENGKLYGGNPEVEFVGDPRAKNGYGVFQKPIIDVANQFKEGIIDYSGHSLNQVLELVKENIPVQVWASIRLQDTRVSTSWIYKPTGEKISWLHNLHSMVIIGFNSKSVYVSDPYTGKVEEYDRRQFEKIYNLFGKRAIYYEK